MKKSTKILSISLLLVILLISGYLSYFYIIRIPTAIATRKLAIKFPDKYTEYTTVKCDLFDFIYPQYAFIDKRPERNYEIFFFKIDIHNILSKEINSDYIGGADIQNTTFPELVKMVKEDCSQFQGGFVNEDLNGIHWTYTRAETEEEKAKEIREKFDRNYSLTPFKDIYGDYNEMTDAEVIALQQKIDKEGLDEKVENIAEIRKTKERLYKLKDKRKHQIIERYGDWKDLEDMDLVRYLRKIDEDFVSGKFRPEE